jgi:hypothetical protein
MATNNAANTYTTPYVDGEVNFPGQCSFMAYLSSTASNVTGNSVGYTLIADTELWDIGSNYNNASGVFTAPQTAVYNFVGGVTCAGITASHTIQLIAFSGGSISQYILDSGINTRDANNQLTVSGSITASLTAGDMVQISVNFLSGTQVVDVVGGSTVYSYFGGRLVE